MTGSAGYGDEDMTMTRPGRYNGGSTDKRRQQGMRLSHPYVLPLPLLHLPPEGAALGELGLTAGGLAQDGAAGGAKDDGGGVGEDGGDLETAGTLHIHEERIGRLNETLQLVLTSLVLSGGVEQIVGDGHDEGGLWGRERRDERKRTGEREKTRVEEKRKRL
jgi:hypothetical protein